MPMRAILFVAFLLAGVTPAGTTPFSYRFTATAPGEIIATVSARCDRCAWDVEGREAVVVKIMLDGRYIQHLPLVRSSRADYQVLIGAVTAGAHTLTLEADADLTSRDLRGAAASVERIT